MNMNIFSDSVFKYFDFFFYWNGSVTVGDLESAGQLDLHDSSNSARVGVITQLLKNMCLPCSLCLSVDSLSAYAVIHLPQNAPEQT